MDRTQLLESIAETVKDYRCGSLPQPIPDHVNNWVKQFDSNVQLGILNELNFVLKKSYLSLSYVYGCLKYTYNSAKNPESFWKSIEFLSIQKGGSSQIEMNELFKKIINESSTASTQWHNANNCYVYLDDVIFSGNRALTDLSNWVKNTAPEQAIVWIISLVAHTNGRWYVETRLKKCINESGKRIELFWFTGITLENTARNCSFSDVLWPTSLPESVQDHVAKMEHKPKLRQNGSLGSFNFFSSFEGRELLEQEFIKKGVDILEKCPLLDKSKRPLGHSALETLGFGSPIVTFRNCPNNAPLVFWVGDPWYPLFPRAINAKP